MKLPSLCVLIGLGTLACGAEDPSAVSDVVSSSSVPAPGAGLDAGVGQTGVPVGTPPTGTGTSSGPSAPVVSNPANPGVNGVCEVRSVDSGRVTPDMLIVLDRSGSMKNGNVNRWDPSVSALKSLTSSLGMTINFGLLAFPGKSVVTAPPPAPTQDCSALTDLIEQIACIATQAGAGGGGGGNNVDTCVAGSVEVPIGANKGAAIGTALDGLKPEGATPTAVSLKAAHDAIGSGLSAVDDVAKPKYVLLVTDGAPNCSSAQSTGGRGFDNQAVDQSVAEISAMAKDGIKTFVIGYDTKSDAQLSSALDRMAQAGNTGDKQHHAIEDGMALLTEFQKIAGVAASCEFALNTTPANPSFVQVKIDDQQINLDDPNGWSISSDRRRITLQGSACASVASTDRHVVSVRVLCEPVMLQ